MNKYLKITIILIVTFFVCLNVKASTFKSFYYDYNPINEEITLYWSDNEGALMYSVYINDELYATITDKNVKLSLKKNKLYNIKLLKTTGVNETEEINRKVYTGTTENVSAYLTNINNSRVEYNRVPGSHGYYIYRSTNNRANYSLVKKIFNNKITSYDEINLEKGKKYYYRVIPIYKINNEIMTGYTYSDVLISTFDDSKVKNVKAKQTDWNNNKITWNKKVGATGYKVYMSTKKKGEYKKIGVTSNNYYNHKNVEYGKTYYYKVVAYINLYNKDIYGKESGISSRFVRPLTPKVNVVVRGNDELVVSYNRASHITNYIIYRASSKKGKFKKIKTTRETTFVDRGLKENKTYYYKVRVLRQLGKKKLYSHYSKVVSEETTERNAKYKLNLKSVYGDNEAYHPSVLYFPDAWNGYKYWLSFTPYPNIKGSNVNGNSAKENPHIKASNNLKNWITPSRTKNPLDTPEGKGLGKDIYNSDGELIYNKELNRIECIWRRYEKQEIILYMSYTFDGHNWSDKEEIYRINKKTNILLSPAIILEDGKYKMWYVDNYKIHYLEFDGIPFENIIDKKVFDIEVEDETIYPWHLEVIKRNNKYEMIYVGTDKISSIRRMSLYYTSSYDNNTWSNAVKILGPSKGADAWDNRGIYRSTFFYMNGKYYILYSASNRNNIKGTSIVYGNSINDLYPLFN